MPAGPAASETFPMRIDPRIGIDALSWELDEHGETRGRVLDLSPMGARLERPYVGGPTPRDMPLLLDVPGIDEVLWARAEVMFDQVVASRSPSAGRLGLVRRTGYRIVVAAARDLRLLRELVFDTHRAHELAASDEMGFASCYTRG